MKAFMEKLDAKTITSAGGILLAAFAMWGYMKLADNRVTELVSSINLNTSAMLEQAKAIQSNTEIMRQLITGPNQFSRINER
jgi:hypothetical protein